MGAPYLRTCFVGQQDTRWIAHYLFCRDVLGARLAPELSERLDRWAEIACSCMSWWPFRGVCFVCERPAYIYIPRRKSPRDDWGAAARFRDGWSAWVIGGVFVDEQAVLRLQNDNMDQIRRVQDAKVKRITIEPRLGSLPNRRRRGDY